MADEQPLANDPGTRTETGEIKDLAATPAIETPKQPEPKVEAKPDDKGKSLLNKGAKDAKDEATGAPEKYEPFKVPDGYELDAKVAEEASAVFKDLNLSQPQAQRLIDLYNKQLAETAEAPYKMYEKMRTGWQDVVKADPEIGSKLAEVKTTVSRAIDSLGDPKLAADFRAAMDLTGAGDNPAFVKTFYKLAQLVTEGTHVTGKGPVTPKAPDAQPTTAARALYPNLP